MKREPWPTAQAVMLGDKREVFHICGLEETSCGSEIDPFAVTLMKAKNVPECMRCQRAGCKQHWPDYVDEAPAVSTKRKGKV